MLRRFDGCAIDEYATYHGWSLRELEQDRDIQGRLFADAHPSPTRRKGYFVGVDTLK